MQFNPAIVGRPTTLKQSAAAKAAASRYAGTPETRDEIHAYIAVRDMALAEAERQTSHMTLNRAFLANELVENSLQPARATYQAQYLPEIEAMAERKRCEAAKTRIAHLRAGSLARRYDCAAAA